MDSNGHPDFVLISSDFGPSQKGLDETPPKPLLALGAKHSSFEPMINDDRDDVPSLQEGGSQGIKDLRKLP